MKTNLPTHRAQYWGVLGKRENPAVKNEGSVKCSISNRALTKNAAPCLVYIPPCTKVAPTLEIDKVLYANIEIHIWYNI